MSLSFTTQISLPYSTTLHAHGVQVSLSSEGETLNVKNRSYFLNFFSTTSDPCNSYLISNTRQYPFSFWRITIQLSKVAIPTRHLLFLPSARVWTLRTGGQRCLRWWTAGSLGSWGCSPPASVYCCGPLSACQIISGIQWTQIFKCHTVKHCCDFNP